MMITKEIIYLLCVFVIVRVSAENYMSSEHADSHKNYDSKSDKSQESFTNHVDSKEYIDKYNNYGRIINPNHIDVDESNPDYQRIAHTKIDLSDDIKINKFIKHEIIPEDVEVIPKKKGYKKNVLKFKKNFYNSSNLIDFTNPPPHNDTVRMARYIVHSVDWAALGTISSRTPTKKAPFVCVKATSDGMISASRGVPFFYMSPMDLCTQDLQNDNRVSVLMTLSQTEYCKNQQLDPQDPRCAKITLSGKIQRIKPGSEEEKFAKNALFSRHPAMATWPADHNWYFSKLKIGQIILLDYFGGATYIRVEDYLNGGPVEPKLKK